jgi:flagellar motor switch/type III secretory pathway protein FliN
LIIRSPWDEIEAGFDFWRNSLIRRTAIDFHHSILTQTLAEILSVSHRLDAAGIDRLHLLDQLEDTVEMALGTKRLGVADLNTSEMGDTLDLF